MSHYVTGTRHFEKASMAPKSKAWLQMAAARASKKSKHDNLAKELDRTANIRFFRCHLQHLCSIDARPR
jgi:hypothetical protein